MHFKKKSNSKKSFKIWPYIVCLIVALVFVAILNCVWYLFEKDKVPFPSPLDYGETLILVIDVISAVIIATATVRIQRKWDKETKKLEDEREDQRKKKEADEEELRRYEREQQFVSERLADFDTISCAEAEFCLSTEDYPRYMGAEQYDFDDNSSFTLKVFNKGNRPLFPSYITFLEDKKCNVKSAVLDASTKVHFKTANEFKNTLISSLDNNMLCLHLNKNNGEWLLPLLTNSLFLKTKKDKNLPKKLVVLLPITVKDNHIYLTEKDKHEQKKEQEYEQLNFTAELLLEFYPKSSFDKGFSFSCRVLCRARVVAE